MPKVSVNSRPDGQTEVSLMGKKSVLGADELAGLVNDLLIAQHRSFMNKGQPPLSDKSETRAVPCVRVYIPDEAAVPTLIFGVGESAVGFEINSVQEVRKMGLGLAAAMDKRLAKGQH